eukprot:TRINITY_DN9377_c0_g1_i1.p1 TRINITY_DN9377_c0_g1~~TRINITY_DN9377_c0_g1_i1.p1  ORF type:complete len:360 (-),score=68.04 TRINITY_DN9377_c0_g1_i1:135-1214(-)
MMWTLCILCGSVALLFIVLYFLVDHVTTRMDLRGKNCIVTGGSQGIGKSLAAQLVQEGANVIIMSRSQQKLDQAVEEIRSMPSSTGQISAVAVNVTDPVSVQRVMSQAAQQFQNRIDVLITCAGQAATGYFDSLTVNDFQQQMNLNYFGAVYACRAALPFVPSGGRILFVGSMAGSCGLVGYSAYAPSKAALHGLAEVLSMELRARNILVSLVMPPDTKTPGFEVENQTKPIECKEMDEGLYLPEDVASSIVSGIKQYRFLITTGFQGFFFSILVAASSPVYSAMSVLLEMLLWPICRFVIAVNHCQWRSIMRRHAHEKHTTSATSNSTISDPSSSSSSASFSFSGTSSSAVSKRIRTS